MQQPGIGGSKYNTCMYTLQWTMESQYGTPARRVYAAHSTGRWTAWKQGRSPGGHGTTTCYSAATRSRVLPGYC
jgi:hypothetical protein